MVLICSLFVGGAKGDDRFVHFESGHTRPLALSPDGAYLLAVNTPDNRLAIFDVGGATLVRVAEVTVGLEPVAVAARVNGATGRTEAWVVNHLSDSVSIVELDAVEPARARVVRTLDVGDEPRDVVFAGSAGDKAFVTTARRGQHLPPGLAPRFAEPGVPRALVWVFDADAPGTPPGGSPITVVELFGDAPRALAASPDGATVYAAVFHSGNRTTIARSIEPPPLPDDSPYEYTDGGLVPPVRDLAGIVRFDPVTAEWGDVFGRDWTGVVQLRLPDYDVFAIDADADPPGPAAGVSRWSSVGTTLFNMAVRPGSGAVYVSNTDARNDVPFAPLAAGGVQGHVAANRITVIDGIAVQPVDVNPHVDHDVATGPSSEITDSLALLTDLTFSPDGTTLFAAALGSNQVAAFDAAALDAGTVVRELVDVGAGPTGVVLDTARDRLYVLNRVDGTISTVANAASGPRTETSAVAIGFDPTPAALRAGRRFLYDARHTSGHGDAACATCHVFGDLDGLAWNLGDPYGPIAPNPNPFVPDPLFTSFGLPFHPVKGAMTTQSLRGLDGAGPMHWRGDRTAADVPGGDFRDERGAFARFNPAFVELLGRSAPLASGEMEAFTDFVLSLRYPPNPVRALDGSMTAEEALGHDAFVNRDIDLFATPCNGCHTLPLGTSLLSTTEITDVFKVPHLRNLYQKIGAFQTTPPADQVRGFGFANDGIQGSLFEFIDGFNLAPADRDGILAFVVGFDTGLAPAVGQQVTLHAENAADPATLARLAMLRGRDAAGDCELVVAARVGGAPRTGVVISTGAVWLDGSVEPLVDGASFAARAAEPDGEQTYTCHPPGTGTRAGRDRDGDGVMNADERDEGTDPDDPASVPFDCVGGALEAVLKPQLKIAKNDVPAGDEQLTIKGSWMLPPDPAIDLARDGLNVLVRGSDGAILLHRRIAGPEWIAKSPSKWSYKTPKGHRGGGVTKAGVTVSAKGIVKVSIAGKPSDFRVARTDLRLEIVLGGQAQAAGGRCATRSFGTAGVKPCVARAKSLKCG